MADLQPDIKSKESSSSGDPHKAEKIRKILSGLESPHSQSVYRCLVDIRTKYATGDSQKSRALVSMGLVAKLIPLLERPNSKIVDVALSILGNLTLHRKPREKLLKCNGVEALYTILTTLNEGNILGRGSRVVGNAAQDKDVRAKLLSVGVLSALVKNLAEVSAPAAKSSVVRALRILGCHDQVRAREILSLNVLSNVSHCLHSDYEELLKSAAKCLAGFSGMITNCEIAAQIQAGEGKGFERLVALCGFEKSGIWESALSTIVNLSQLENLRPMLGNAGAVEAIIVKINLCGQSMKVPSYSRSVRALCRYSRESVNRMKLRESGGLKLFVGILLSRSSADAELHDSVIESIRNFAYDNSSMIMLQNEGLILALVKFVEDYNEQNYVKHSCEMEICENDVKTSDDSIANDDVTLEEQETLENVEDSSVSDENVENQDYVENEESLPENITEPCTVVTNDVLSNCDAENIAFVSTNPDQAEPEVEEVVEITREQIKAMKQFRVSSPSYQAVQDEVLAFARLRDEYNCLSPPVSLYASTFPSPERCSPPDSIQSSPFQSPGRSEEDSSDMDLDLEDESSSNRPDDESRYSPVEFMSGDEDDDSSNIDSVVVDVSKEAAAATWTSFSTQKQTNSGTASFSSPQPTGSGFSTPQQTALPKSRPRPLQSSPLSPLQYLVPASPSTSSNDNAPLINFSFVSLMNESCGKKSDEDPENWRMSQVLQLLSRLTQFEVPHENLTSLKTSKALVKYLCQTSKPSPRAERIILRISKNLYCLMPYVHQCQLSWIHLQVFSRQTLPDSSCQSCQKLQDFSKHVVQNFSYLAETGYAEGMMCHALVRGPDCEKKTIAVGIPILIRPRKLLRNVLLAHGGLDILMEVLENKTTDNELFSHAVLSVKILSEHVGVVSPELKLIESFDENTNCYFEGSIDDKDLMVNLDNNETIHANRAILSRESCVFEAMFFRDFAESNQSSISIKLASKSATVALFHYLYGCRNCTLLQELDIDTLVELVSLSDKFLVSDFNRTISGRVVRQCLVADQVVGIYEKSLQSNYPVLGIEENLNICTTSFVLVGNFAHQKRVSIFRELVASKMCSDFIDDVTKTITQKL